MANITDVQAVAFCNNRIRPLADIYGSIYYRAKLMIAEFNSKGLASLIPNDGLATVVDGSAVDGRTPITGADVNIFLSNMQALVTQLEATSNLLLNQSAKLWVNPNK